MFGLFRKTDRSPENKFDLWKGNAIVTEAIHPDRRGRVQFRGSWWFARGVAALNVAPGAWVNVIGRDEMTLLVELPEAMELQEN
ncbi:MAG: NfeD family protein [Cyanobacteria bacterium P01_E01_bin.42]